MAIFTGLTDSKQGLASFWFRPNAGDGTTRTLFAGGSRVSIQLNTSNRIDNVFRNSGGTVVMRRQSSVGYSAGPTWRHALLSFDLAATTALLYVNDAVPSLTGSVTTTDGIVDYDGAGSYAVGADVGGAFKFNGDIADFFFHPAFLDISVEANRRKFISALGKPVDLGADGSTPLAVKPILFLSGAAASFATNKGSGGGMTTNGALTDAGTSP